MPAGGALTLKSWSPASTSLSRANEGSTSRRRLCRYSRSSSFDKLALGSGGVTLSKATDIFFQATVSKGLAPEPLE